MIPPSIGLPRRGLGGACFRSDALPVVLLITDAPMHDGPDGADPFRDSARPPHGFDATMDALRAHDVRVIGLGARDSGRPGPLDHLRRVAQETGAVDEAGAPLAFDIGGSGDRVDSSTVSAIERLASGVPLDVGASVEDTSG